MIDRPDYINAITPFIDKPLVKILAGIRRCGKSTIFEMLKLELLKRGVSEGNIIQKECTEMDIPESTSGKGDVWRASERDLREGKVLSSSG